MRKNQEVVLILIKHDGVSVKDDAITVGLSISASSKGEDYEMSSNGRFQYICQSQFFSKCDRRDQRDCDGNPIVK